MPSEWITIIGTLGGVIVGAVSGYFLKRLELLHSRKLEQDKADLARLENLHLVIARCMMDSTRSFSVLSHMRFSDRSYPDRLQSVSLELELQNQPMAEVVSLLFLYAPDHSTLFDKVVVAQEKLSTMWIDCMNPAKATVPPAVEWKAYMTAWGALLQAVGGQISNSRAKMELRAAQPR